MTTSVKVVCLAETSGNEVVPGSSYATLPGSTGSETPRFVDASELSEINESVLHTFGGSWGAPPDLPIGWEEDDRLRPVRKQAVAFLKRVEEDSFLLLRDARLALTLPFWRTSAPVSGIVLVVREPTAVAATMAHNLGWSPDEAADWWLRYTSSGWCSAQENLFIEYDHLGANPQGVTRRLEDFLNLPEGIVGPALLQSAIMDGASEGYADISSSHPKLSLATALFEAIRTLPKAYSNDLVTQVASSFRSSGSVQETGKTIQTQAEELDRLRSVIEGFQERLLEEIEAREFAKARVERLGSDLEDAKRHPAETEHPKRSEPRPPEREHVEKTHQAEQRAERAEQQYESLRNATSVRLALRLAHKLQPLKKFFR